MNITWNRTSSILPENNEYRSLIVMTDMGKCFESYYHDDKFHCMREESSKCYYDDTNYSDSIVYWMVRPLTEEEIEHLKWVASDQYECADEDDRKFVKYAMEEMVNMKIL